MQASGPFAHLSILLLSYCIIIFHLLIHSSPNCLYLSQSFIHSLIHLFIPSFIHSLIVFIFLNHSPLIHSFIHSFIHLFIVFIFYLLIHSSLHCLHLSQSIIHSLIYSFIHPLIVFIFLNHSFIPSLIYSFIHSLNNLFIH